MIWPERQSAEVRQSDAAYVQRQFAEVNKTLQLRDQIDDKAVLAIEVPL